jgi:biofilm PGA synthesis N-glycosyltransferase PgaC
MITEDIDISWQLQMDHWDIRYEPEALCYVYMPETLKGLWQQRLRWAQGGVEVILRYTRDMLGWKQRRFWLVPIEYIIGVTWSYSMLLVCIIFFVGLIFPIPPVWRVDTLFPTWGGLILGVTCLTQFFISLWIDRRYERGHFLRNYIWIIWYPLLYWILSMLTTVVAVPKTLLKKRGERARWESPDRGVNPTDKQV